jgi:glyoxylase-like metal-dependent hydrolase (beta-lactamase superfamily II)
MTIRYSWRVLRAGEFRLDAGSMLGLIPRSVWSRSLDVDDKNRMRVHHNCVLLERSGDAPAGAAFAPKTVLIETGTGDKLDDKSRDLFALTDRTVLTALHEANCAATDVGAVFVSHLHFDHAGGLTRLARPGETPDWHGPASGMAGARPDHSVKFSFPSARLVVQRREWDDALANRSVMTRTYFADHLRPYALDATSTDAMRERVLLADSPAPFTPGATPDRAELPLLTLDQRSFEPVPGIRVFRVPGHTWGQQAVMFTDTQGRTVVFTPDVMPTAAHLGAAYSLAYDVEPYTSMVTKHWFLSHAADQRWTLVLDHEPGNPVRTVTRNTKGWFDLAESGE